MAPAHYRFLPLLPFLTVLPLAAQEEGAIRLPIHSSRAHFKLDASGPFYQQEIVLTWKEVPPPAGDIGYYAMYAFDFANKVTGYMGLQWDKRGKKAIFSIWDEPDTITSNPEGNCRRFGHEGNGASCIQPLDWIAGESYRLWVRRVESLPWGERWQAGVTAVSSGKSFVTGSIALKNGAAGKGYGGLTPGGITVLEYYGTLPEKAVCAMLPPVEIAWSGPFVTEGVAVSPLSTRVEYPKRSGTRQNKAPPCHNSTVAVQPGYVTIQTAGGQTRRITPADTRFEWQIPQDKTP
ncbi:MAG: hypothetical protein HQL56_11470 [Magnetococcales bacterium]|nr:hypothetical protein [Magnetococcales bacterium]